MSRSKAVSNIYNFLTNVLYMFISLILKLYCIINLKIMYVVFMKIIMELYAYFSNLYTYYSLYFLLI